MPETDATNEVFRALADASRRQLLDSLRSDDGQTLNQLCEGLAMSRQAVSKHLAILAAAGLVVTEQKGGNKHHYLNPVPLIEMVDRWVDPYRQRQADALVRLRNELENKL